MIPMKPSLYRFILYPVATVFTLFMLVASCQPTLQTGQLAIVNSISPSAPVTTSCKRDTLADVTEIVIGVMYPLSDQSTMTTGFAMQAATNLALADINAQASFKDKPVRLIVYDSGSSPEQGALFAERLVTVDCAAAIVGVFHSTVALAVKEVAVRYHIPVVFADPYADEITSDHAAEIFRIAPTRTMVAQMMGQWMEEVGDYNQDGEILLALVVENSRYGSMRGELVQQWMPTYGIEPEVFTIDLPTTDFSPLIARIVALDKLPDVVFAYLHKGDNVPLLRQLLAAGIGPTRSTLLVTTSTALDETHFWDQVPDGIYTIVTQVGPWPSAVTPMGQRFADTYQQYFNRWPEATAFEAYDALWLMTDAIQRAGTLNPDDVIHALEETDIELASGYYYFPYNSTNAPDGTIVPHYMWHQWPNPPILYLQYAKAGQSRRDAPVIWPPTYQTVTGPLAPELQSIRSR